MPNLQCHIEWSDGNDATIILFTKTEDGNTALLKAISLTPEETVLFREKLKVQP